MGPLKTPTSRARIDCPSRPWPGGTGPTDLNDSGHLVHVVFVFVGHHQGDLRWLSWPKKRRPFSECPSAPASPTVLCATAGAPPPSCPAASPPQARLAIHHVERLRLPASQIPSRHPKPSGPFIGRWPAFDPVPDGVRLELVAGAFSFHRVGFLLCPARVHFYEERSLNQGSRPFAVEFLPQGRRHACQRMRRL